MRFTFADGWEQRGRQLGWWGGTGRRHKPYGATKLERGNKAQSTNAEGGHCWRAGTPVAGLARGGRAAEWKRQQTAAAGRRQNEMEYRVAGKGRCHLQVTVLGKVAVTESDVWVGC